ncbi:hypothetical protein LCGC14_2538440, partial [marine sediment metagenome]
MPKCRYCDEEIAWRVDEEGRGVGELIHVERGLHGCDRDKVGGAFADVALPALKADEAVTLIDAIAAGSDTTEDRHRYWETAESALRLI